MLPLSGKKEVELETRWLRKYKVLNLDECYQDRMGRAGVWLVLATLGPGANVRGGDLTLAWLGLGLVNVKKPDCAERCQVPGSQGWRGKVI